MKDFMLLMVFATVILTGCNSGSEDTYTSYEVVDEYDNPIYDNNGTLQQGMAIDDVNVSDITSITDVDNISVVDNGIFVICTDGSTCTVTVDNGTTTTTTDNNSSS